MKYTFEDAIVAFKNKGYELLSKIDEYKNCATKLKYICPKHRDKGIQEISLSRLNQGRGCYYCGREKTINSRIKPFDIVGDKKLAESKGFTYINTRKIKNIVHIDFICNKHQEFGVQSMRKWNMKRETCKGCKYCKGDFPEWYVKEQMKNINPDIILLDDYINISTKIKCKCIKHDLILNKSPQDILSGQGCYYCGLEKLSKNNTLSQTDYEQRLFKANPNLIVIGEYKGMEYDIEVKCKKCGYIWFGNAHSLVSNGTSCKKCSYTYKGENKIIEILSDLSIDFIHQYKFDNCKDKRVLPFDFYLPKYNICIEFDGQQHFEPRFGYKNFIQTQKHDCIKNKYCKKNNIKLIRIPYWEFNNIKSIIIKELNIT